MSAQIVEVNAGASTVYQAEGASVTLHFPQSAMTFGGGFSNGHFRLGASDEFSFHGWNVTAGDNFLSLSTASAGLAIPTRGVSITRRGRKLCDGEIPIRRRPALFGYGAPCTPETTLTVFLGGTGDAFQNPFFSAGSTTHFGAGLNYERHYQSGLTLSALLIAAPLRNTALAGFDWKCHGLKIQAGGGLLQDAPYANAQITYQARQ